MEYLISEVPIVYQYMPYEGGKLLLQNMTVMVKNPSEFNDPFDCDKELLNFESSNKERFKKSIEKFNSKLKNPTPKNNLIDYDNLTKEKVIEVYKNYAFTLFLKSFGVACFSEKPDIPLMWSHYTRSHKGICIGFDITKLFESLREIKQNEIALIRVNYTKEFEKVDYFKDYNEALYHLVKTKSDIWSYEREVRLMFTNLELDESNKTILPFNKSAISEIYLGNKISEENRNWIKDFCRENLEDVDFFQMNKPSNSFTLYPKRMNY